MSSLAENVFGASVVDLSAPQKVEVQSVPNGPEADAVFVGYQLEFLGGCGTLHMTQVLSVSIPVSIRSDQALVGFLQQLTVSVARSTGVRVLVVLDAAGTSHSLEFESITPNGTISIPEEFRFWRTYSYNGVELSPGSGLPGPARDYQATILVTMQRRTLSDTCRVSIDGLDVFATVF